MTRIVGVMPTYNQERFIEDALKSSVGKFDELVICDDGSTDDTHEILKRWEGSYSHVSVVTHENNLGTASAINTAVAHLSPDYDWLTWCSSDNTYADEGRVIMEESIETGFGVIYTPYLWGLSGQHGSHIEHQNHYPDRLVNQHACYYGPSFIIRKPVWDRAGVHRGKISHDYDHWLRVEEACWEMGYQIALCGEPRTPYLFYNAHDERVTITRKHEYDAPYWQAEALKRRAGRCG